MKYALDFPRFDKFLFWCGIVSAVLSVFSPQFLTVLSGVVSANRYYIPMLLPVAAIHLMYPAVARMCNLGQSPGSFGYMCLAWAHIVSLLVSVLSLSQFDPDRDVLQCVAVASLSVLHAVQVLRYIIASVWQLGLDQTAMRQNVAKPE